MTTYAQLRRLAADCRAEREKAPLDPDSLDALLDIAELHDAARGEAEHRPEERVGSTVS
ncbi:hypothetical protein I8D64_04840 [Brachybacterium sp. MASK1Z-5]|uniref:Uncharacterized protein n=1 Tax=Brachybacterium halotolerans TaxID=2795215 RepID=A0ABS1B7U1_9MICO|nr:hypothetical protein [Brachybacterium halotolerans]MBK0330723.1 hypothetical protein [Brachybacterium halotolerans]